MEVPHADVSRVIPGVVRQRLVPPDVDWEGLTPDLRAMWSGIVWSREGRGDLAWWGWAQVDDPALLAWRDAERGRVLRELGLHDMAEAIEAPALERADDPVVEVMLRISLTADAVGRNDVPTAAERLAEAQALASELGATADSPRLARQRLRLAWVGAEVDWIHGRDPDGTGLPTRGPDNSVQWPADHAHGSDFHRAKSLLFAGMVHRDLVLLDRAAGLAPAGLAWAVHLARLELGALDGAARAGAAWARCVAPPHVADVVAASPTAQRLVALLDSGRS